MTFEELDHALEELETRLERLRALYEQYFLGFEKIEPTVPRKDVDRRIYVLRREKIRNTGRRFKLQTLIQRYNTFQQYWQRICREIENGTYRRHVLRAERSMGTDKQLTIATRRRFGKVAAIEAAAAAAAGDGAGYRPEAAAPESGPAALESVRPAAAATESVRPPAPPSSRPAQRPSTVDRSFESLELDMGFLGSWIPPAPKAALKVGSSPKAAPGPKADKPASSPKAAAKAAPPAREASPSKSTPKAAAPPKQKSSPRAAPPPKPTVARDPARPPKPAPGVPEPAAPLAAAPPKPERAAPPPKPGATRPAAKPEAAEAARAMSDDRMRELHQKLMDMKRQNRESGQVSYETLAKTLRDTENKLRSQHKNRKIEFDVVIRDGKAIVKPTVR